MTKIQDNYPVGSSAYLFQTRVTGYRFLTVTRHNKDGGLSLVGKDGRKVRVTARGEIHGGGWDRSYVCISPEDGLDRAEGARVEVARARRVGSIRLLIQAMNTELQSGNPDMAVIAKAADQITRYTTEA